MQKRRCPFHALPIPSWSPPGLCINDTRLVPQPVKRPKKCLLEKLILVNGSGKSIFNGLNQALGDALQGLGHLGDDLAAKVVGGILQHLEVQQHDGAQDDEPVELGLGVDNDLQRGRDRRAQVGGGAGDGEGLLGGQHGRLLGRLGGRLDLLQQLRRLDGDGERAEQVALPVAHGGAQVRGLGLDAGHGVGDGLAVGDGGGREGHDAEDGGETHGGRREDKPEPEAKGVSRSSGYSWQWSWRSLQCWGDEVLQLDGS